MTGQIGIIYSTVDGQTLKICKVLANHLKEQHQNVRLFSVEAFDQKVSDFDGLVIGASVRYGKHNHLVQKFISKNKTELDRVKTAFFSVNLVARKSERSSPETNPYFKKFIDTVDWKPDLAAVFAGKLDYANYSFWDRILIKCIMKFTNGPTKTETAIEFTDWKKVNLLSEKIWKLLQASTWESKKSIP